MRAEKLDLPRLRAQVEHFFIVNLVNWQHVFRHVELRVALSIIACLSGIIIILICIIVTIAL